jgi:2-polyprenyl-3-methyl-5-hydroxy-6-metoxy-1,4-benzoquinol methylase
LRWETFNPALPGIQSRHSANDVDIIVRVPSERLDHPEQQFRDTHRLMAPASTTGTEGYSERASNLVANWERHSFAEKHAWAAHLIPVAPSKVLDIGSGSGGDAAALARMGHSVVAVEPVEELRGSAMALHSSPTIEWLKDSLPDLTSILARHEAFDLIMLTAVWMHLSLEQRQRAMPNIAMLAGPGGSVIMSLRHGPTPPGRVMFDVSAAETKDLAGRHGLRCVAEQEGESIQEANRRSGITWTRLAFTKRS